MFHREHVKKLSCFCRSKLSDVRLTFVGHFWEMCTKCVGHHEMCRFCRMLVPFACVEMSTTFRRKPDLEIWTLAAIVFGMRLLLFFESVDEIMTIKDLAIFAWKYL